MDVYKIKDRYIQKHQPTLYYLDGGPKRSFVFEELQTILDPELLDTKVILVPSVSSGSSALVCTWHIDPCSSLLIFVSKQRSNLESSFYL